MIPYLEYSYTLYYTKYSAFTERKIVHKCAVSGLEIKYHSKQQQNNHILIAFSSYHTTTSLVNSNTFIKMLSGLALALPLLALTASAAPTSRAASVQVQFANDVTGADGNAYIPLDGSLVELGQAYANTNLEVAGTLNVTSLQFTSNFQNVACTVFKNGATVVASIADPGKDFETFSQKPLNWQTGFEISCAVASTHTRRTANTVQVQFANDVTGANGNALIPLDGTPIVLGQAYANTNLEVAGTLFVTSLQFTANFQNVVCDVLKDGTTNVAHIADPGQDFDKFSQKPLNWQAGFTISCTLPHSA